MKQGFYRRLAWTGIRSNRRLYLPYLLTCAGMVMMTYIVTFLSASDAVRAMRGGDVMQGCLNLGSFVITFFALIFLFYTHSFLIRRRKKEFGLYNILGMGKRHIAVVLLWESGITAVLSLAGGLLAGIVCSKLAEMCVFYLLGGTAGYSLLISPGSVGRTLIIFLVIYVLILLDTLRQIRLTNPITLLRSENAGEKPPKANWFLAVLGLLILGGAYWIAVSIQDPVQTLLLFFVAVLMVIAATYLLFVSASVAICRALQKNQRYYYRTNHFVSVSSMVFRMKRNGAGLASICILCTMVLVMISTTVCLYAGAEDSLRTRYPRNLDLTLTMEQLSDLEGGWVDEVRTASHDICTGAGLVPERVLDYRAVLFAGVVEDDQIKLDLNFAQYASEVWQIFLIPIEDYNTLMGAQETLAEDEVILYSTHENFSTSGTIQVENGPELRVKKMAPTFVSNGTAAMQIIPTLYIFVPNLEAAVQPVIDAGQGEWIDYTWNYAFDLSCPYPQQIAVQDQIWAKLDELREQSQDQIVMISCDSVAAEREGFYSLYGSLLFLGVLLGVVFVFAAVLIIYYKQISEGYEDQSRFAIMQKVGMTKREIRKSINSQILTVFFLPLILAGVHLAFAFPMLQKLLMLFGLTNVSLLVLITLVCYLVFAVCYLLIYRVTSRAYYGIVSGVRDEAV